MEGRGGGGGGGDISCWGGRGEISVVGEGGSEVSDLKANKDGIKSSI